MQAKKVSPTSAGLIPLITLARMFAAILATVSRAQLRYLDQRIKALGLERERVLRWIRRASRGQLQTFTDLTPELYERLLPKLERWAKTSANGGNGNPMQTENGRTVRTRR